MDASESSFQKVFFFISMEWCVKLRINEDTKENERKEGTVKKTPSNRVKYEKGSKEKDEKLIQEQIASSASKIKDHSPHE